MFLFFEYIDNLMSEMFFTQSKWTNGQFATLLFAKQKYLQAMFGTVIIFHKFILDFSLQISDNVLVLGETFDSSLRFVLLSILWTFQGIAF